MKPLAWTIEVADTALLVIDMQRDFCSPHGYAARAGLDVARLAGPIGQIRRLLDAARGAGLLVVHTREGHLPDLSDCPAEKMQRSRQAGAPIGSVGPMGRLLVRGEYGHDFIDELQPATGEAVIDKPGYGAFYQTGLAQLLTNRCIRQLIVCGVTPRCACIRRCAKRWTGAMPASPWPMPLPRAIPPCRRRRWQ
ncbi:isochorismatase family cysteine hydrolase [Polaromonas sp. CG_23.6]|uniref:cysteine hydrolase family protein n=1 Tax=unclassified Polaromonas TaxID=2638319 RepID=UPI001A24B2CB|nr:isochorismatase family cysteine hydrolase [Polaromonas sp. CG_23.6]MBG6073365.1 nicotinamidase-related amidase [Polaromonas sp. CG_9.7]MBG6115296.1 nicotinamidase-related amidase [Polaromonas sp. CG_9.2]MDH6183001.1 nicotinamidase-related amidase [Polaromonas sp. CG_23.6]